jgi:hypothetical protein
MAWQSGGHRHIAPLALTDLCACPRCHGIVEGGASTCAGCGQWLGPASVVLWCALVVAGGALTLAAFFLPWLTSASATGEQVLSGFDLARIAQRLAATSATRPTAAASLALYLVPVAAATMIGLPPAATLLHLRWVIVGRLLVGLAALPCQLAVLAALVALGLVGDGSFSGWPQIGVAVAGAGSLVALVGGVVLGGRRPARVVPAGWIAVTGDQAQSP